RIARDQVAGDEGSHRKRKVRVRGRLMFKVTGRLELNADGVMNLLAAGHVSADVVALHGGARRGRLAVADGDTRSQVARNDVAGPERGPPDECALDAVADP